MTAAAERKVGVVVSLLTIQVVTVLFVVVSAFIWLLPALPADDHGPGKIYIEYVGPLSSSCLPLALFSTLPYSSLSQFHSPYPVTSITNLLIPSIYKY
jgi:hypothetical protein